MNPEEQREQILAQLTEARGLVQAALAELAEFLEENDLLPAARPRGFRLRTTVIVLLAVLMTLPPLFLLIPFRGFDEPVAIAIEPGLSKRAIARRLAERGVLYSPWPFLLYSALRPGATLKAGEYLFDKPMSAAGVFRKLARAQVRLYTLTIPEGWTRWEIADEVARLHLANRGDFLRLTETAELIQDLAPEAATLEGYLFPDTYRFPRPAQAETIVRVMVTRFRRVFDELNGARADGDTRSAHEIVTLASLVEEETGADGERGLIASVYSNRLRRRMRLQCDPTVIYAARLAHNGEFDGVINVSDLERKSPYNTYRNYGLPPGPIASAGRQALAAALRPPVSDYLYFVSNTEGGHYFARTGREHNRNVRRYRRLRAQKQNQGGSNP